MAYKTLVTIVIDCDTRSRALEAAVAMAEAHGRASRRALPRHRPDPARRLLRRRRRVRDPGRRWPRPGPRPNALEADGARAAGQTRRPLRGRWPPACRRSARSDPGRRLHPVRRPRDPAASPTARSAAPSDVAIVEAALFAGSAPVLVLPAGATPAPSRRAASWWPGTRAREALNAVRAALPLLREAPDRGHRHRRPAAPRARTAPTRAASSAQMLSRHGVRAEVSVLAGRCRRCPTCCCATPRDRDADLMVMGAYGHSRFREAILGGATRNMLRIGRPCPVLMAH